MSKALNSGKEEEHSVAIDDLLEVETCLRDMLQSASDPAVLNRLYNLHHEITRYISEIANKR